MEKGSKEQGGAGRQDNYWSLTFSEASNLDQNESSILSLIEVLTDSDWVSMYVLKHELIERENLKYISVFEVYVAAFLYLK